MVQGRKKLRAYVFWRRLLRDGISQSRGSPQALPGKRGTMRARVEVIDKGLFLVRLEGVERERIQQIVRMLTCRTTRCHLPARPP